MGLKTTTVTSTVIAATILLFSSACQPPPPHLVLVTLDTVRADHCSVYGYHRPTTPFLEQMAAAGVVAESGYAPMAVTGPSHATLFASRYPIDLGMHRNGTSLENTPLLSQALLDQGYDTAAFVSSFVVSRKFGFAAGFTHFDDDFHDATTSIHREKWEGHKVEGNFDRAADETNAKVLQWLASRDRQEPVFLWIHYFDAHSPHNPRPPYDELFDEPENGDDMARLVALYDEEIRFVDDQLSLLFNAVDRTLGDNVLKIVVGDHGEGFMQHGWPTHGPNIYEEDVRVPLILSWPGHLPSGLRVSTPIGLVDLAPTILDLLDAHDPPESFTGQSWARGLRAGNAVLGDNPLYFIRRTYTRNQARRKIGPWSRETVTMRADGVKYGVRRGEWKYIEAPQEGTKELYSLIEDPNETVNLADQQPGLVTLLSRDLATWHERQSTSSDHPPIELSPADLEALRALGYVQ